MSYWKKTGGKITKKSWHRNPPRQKRPGEKLEELNRQRAKDGMTRDEIINATFNEIVDANPKLKAELNKDYKAWNAVQELGWCHYNVPKQDPPKETAKQRKSRMAKLDVYYRASRHQRLIQHMNSKIHQPHISVQAEQKLRMVRNDVDALKQERKLPEPDYDQRTYRIRWLQRQIEQSNDPSQLKALEDELAQWVNK